MANVDHAYTYISHLQRDQAIGYKNVNSAYINNLIAVLCVLFSKLLPFKWFYHRLHRFCNWLWTLYNLYVSSIFSHPKG